MAKHTIKGFILYGDQPSGKGASFSHYKPSSDDYFQRVIVCEHSFEIEISDDFDPRPGLIAALKEKERQARADFEKLCTDIRRQISQYEAITNEVR